MIPPANRLGYDVVSTALTRGYIKKIQDRVVSFVSTCAISGIFPHSLWPDIVMERQIWWEERWGDYSGIKGGS